MRILMPFWRLENFDRYIPQMTAIAYHVDEFHVVYSSGVPKTEWQENFEFHKVHIGYPRLKSIMLRWFFAKEKVLKQVEQIDVDLYYALSGWWSQEFCYDCSRRFKKPYVVRLRGDYVKDMEARIENPFIKWISNRSKLKSYRNANLIIPVSKNVRDSATEWIGDLSKLSPIVPSGVDTNKFKPDPIEHQDFTVAYVGRISPEKGIKTLVKTMRLAKDIHFIVAGEKQMGVEFPENCEYLGRTPYEQMPDIYNRADLVILTSETEGMPLVILEAYACDVPVLTHKDVFPSELPIYGIVQPHNDPKEYVESIHRIKEGYCNMIDARFYVERHLSWKSFGEKIYKQFELVYGTNIEENDEELSLDIGCGFLPIHHSKKATIGLELNLDKAPNKEVLKGKSLVMSDAQNLCFKSKVFDKISWMAVLEHLPKPIDALVEGDRCLKNDGKIEVGLPIEHNHLRHLLHVLYSEFPFGLIFIVKILYKANTVWKIHGVPHVNTIKPWDLEAVFNVNKVETNYRLHTYWRGGYQYRLMRRIFRGFTMRDKTQGEYIIYGVKKLNSTARESAFGKQASGRDF